MMEPIRLDRPGGRTLLIRPAGPADADGVERLYAGLDEDDLYRRFFTSRPPPRSVVEKLVGAGRRGGYALVAVESGPGRAERVVAEGSFGPLEDGNAELGLTVDRDERGWLGPYLLDLLVTEAARMGVANLEADVLATNRPMLAVLESRGSAVMDRFSDPAVVRLCVGTADRSAAWSEHPRRPRLLVEAHSGWWRAEGAARRSGFEVLACPGPSRRLSRCPALDGRPCPLAAGADVIVVALRDATAPSLLAAHRRLHPGATICIDAVPDGSGAGVGEERYLDPDAGPDDVAATLAGLAGHHGAGRLGTADSGREEPDRP